MKKLTTKFIALFIILAMQITTFAFNPLDYVTDIYTDETGRVTTV